MKGKIILALASIFAGTALFGSTFAASTWAVTDDAPTKTGKISGEKVEADTTTAYVTLEYGASTELTDVANLESGTIRYAGKVGLKATYTGAESYKGLLTVRLTQPEKSGEKLIDYLKVRVYDKEPTYDSDKIVSATAAETTTYITLDGTAETPVLSASRSLSMTNGSEKVVYFVVELDASAGVAAVLNAVKSDLVTLSVDWDHDTNGQTITESELVYYKPSVGENEDAYLYAWKGKAYNAEYPGVKMSKDADGYYYYEINTTLFDHFILSYGNGTEAGNTKAREADFAITELDGVNNYFNGTEWAKKPAADPTLVADYYVVGDMNSWLCNSAYALTEVENAKETEYKSAVLTLAAGAKLKVRTNSNEAEAHWYSSVSTWENCGFTIDNEGNVVVTAAGNYEVHFYPNSANNNCVTLQAQA